MKVIDSVHSPVVKSRGRSRDKYGETEVKLVKLSESGIVNDKGRGQ